MNPASNRPDLKAIGARRLSARGLPATAAFAIPCRPGPLTGRGFRLARGQSGPGQAPPFGMLGDGAAAVSRNQLTDFRELNGEGAVEGGEHHAAFLGQRDQIEIVPLPVACHPCERHRPGAIQVGGHKLHSAPMREQPQQSQRLGRRVQGRQNLAWDTAGPAEDLQERQLRQRRQGKRPSSEETVRPLMMFVLRDDQRRQPVGVQQVVHPSFSVAATSSAVIGTPSLRASGIPWRVCKVGSADSATSWLTRRHNSRKSAGGKPRTCSKTTSAFVLTR